MDKAMNLTYGDLILIEMALLEKVGQLDLSMQSGIYFSELIGKVEYQLQEMKVASAGAPGEELNKEPIRP